MNWQCLCGTYVREKRFCPRCKLLRFKIERPVIMDYFDLKLGTVAEGLPFNLSLSRILQHVLISGQTGTGKSRFTMNLAIKAENYPLPVRIRLLVMDVEGEWKGIIPHLKQRTVYYDVGKNLRINPFDLNDAALVKELFKETIFKGIEQEYSDLSAQMNFVLTETISQSRSLVDLIKNIKRYSDHKLTALDRTKTALLVRLHPFTQTPLKEIFLCQKSTIDFNRIDETNVIIDLHNLDANVAYKNELRLIYNIISSYYLRKMLNRETRNSVTNVFIADEAQILVPKILKKLVVTESWPATEFATRLRKRGCGLVLSTQSPSNIESDIFKNTGTKITFRLQYPEDIKLISESCGFVDHVEYQFLSDRFVRLQSKQAIVSTIDNEPFLVTSDEYNPTNDEPDVIPYDEEVEIEEDDDERILLESIDKKPFLPVRKRRVLLGWNDKRYYRVLDSLIRKGKLETQSVKLGRGAPIVLYQRPGKTPSIRHEFYVHWIKERVKDAQTNIKEGPDIVIPKQNVAIEVELGKSDIHLNIRRDAQSFEKVIVCSDQKKLLEALSRENKLSNVLFLPVQKVPAFVEKMQAQNELKHI